jgi:type IV pilus biogenesis protein CpaD/CtpE
MSPARGVTIVRQRQHSVKLSVPEESGAAIQSSIVFRTKATRFTERCGRYSEKLRF